MDAHNNADHAIKRQDFPQTPSIPPMDLFDTLPHWLDSPVLAYTSWINKQKLRPSTKTVYIAMFSRFCAWLTANGRALATLDRADIHDFLQAPNENLPTSRQHAQTTRQRRQYVKQLERVFSHLGMLGFSGRNPGRQAILEKIDHGRDKPSRFLSSEEIRAVLGLIQKRLDELRSAETSEGLWLNYRDLALVSVMIGAGLKVQHVVGLTLNCMHLQEETIELSQMGYTHRARILAFAVAPLKAWIAVLESLQGESLRATQRIFPADKSCGFARTSKNITLAASSVHRRTRRFLAEAGITGERACAQTLRNTYAGLLIEGGATNEHLVDFLGLQVTITAQRLRSAFARSRATTTPIDPFFEGDPRCPV